MKRLAVLLAVFAACAFFSPVAIAAAPPLLQAGSSTLADSDFIPYGIAQNEAMQHPMMTADTCELGVLDINILKTACIVEHPADTAILVPKNADQQHPHAAHMADASTCADFRALMASLSISDERPVRDARTFAMDDHPFIGLPLKVARAGDSVALHILVASGSSYGSFDLRPVETCALTDNLSLVPAGVARSGPISSVSIVDNGILFADKGSVRGDRSLTTDVFAANTYQYQAAGLAFAADELSD